MQSYNVFLIDDNLKFLESAFNYLNSCPKINSLGWALNTDDFIGKLDGFLPDFILVDFSMPKTSGMEVVLELKKFYPEPKIYFLSLNDDPAYVEASIAAGADGFINKNKFVKEIRKMLL